MTVAAQVVDRSVSELVLILEGEMRDGVLLARDPFIENSLELRNVRVDELRIERGVFVGNLVFTDCSMNRISFSETIFSGHVTFNNCVIDLLEIRCQKTKKPLLLSNCRIGELLTYQYSEISIQRGRFARDLRIVEAVQITAADIRAHSLALSSTSQKALGRIDLSQVRVATTLEIDGLTVDKIQLKSVMAEHLSIERCMAAMIDLDRVRVSQGLDFAVAAPSDSDLRVEISGDVLGPLSVRLKSSDGSPGTARADFHSLAVQGDLTLSGGFVATLRDTTVNGVLRLRELDNLVPQLSLERGFDAREVELPLEAFRTVEQVRTYARTILGNDSSAELAIIHKSLSGRPTEQDVAFYAQRMAEVATRRPVGRVWGTLRAFLFGWGVLPSRPVMSLLLGFLLSAVAIFFLRGFAPESASVSATEALIFAASLWLNAGIWMPVGVVSPAWSLFGLVCSGSGLVLTTVAVGILIRRLVR